MPRRAEARIDLAAIEHNCVLHAAAPGAMLCAVVKADGYGHGALEAARAALRGGAEWLAVATANEARHLRDGGIEGRVLVMGALSPSELDTAVASDADVVAWTPEFVDGVRTRGGARIHVKLDTGMGRLGTRDEQEATAVLERAGEQAVGLMTHFATADDRSDPFMADQLRRFVAWAGPHKERRPGLILHAVNSAGTLRDTAAHLDLVRCGIAIYGLDPFGEDPAQHDLRPALTLASYVAVVKVAQPGESAGYGRRFVAERPTVIATVPIGYADGVRRALTNNAEALVGGRRCLFVGTVSMDNITLAVGDDVAVGDEVVLIGRQGGERVLAEEWAQRLDTINYEVTCGISGRVPRIHA